MISTNKETIFKWKHYQPNIIVLTVCWYLRYKLSLPDLVGIIKERGLSLAHTTIMRGVYQYGLKLNKWIQKYFKLTNKSWRIDETYLKIKGDKMYLYRKIDSEGNTIDFYLSQKRDAKAANSWHATKTVDKPLMTIKTILIAIHELKEEKWLPLRMNNMQQYH